MQLTDSISVRMPVHGFDPRPIMLNEVNQFIEMHRNTKQVSSSSPIARVIRMEYTVGGSTRDALCRTSKATPWQSDECLAIEGSQAKRLPRLKLRKQRKKRQQTTRVGRQSIGSAWPASREEWREGNQQIEEPYPRAKPGKKGFYLPTPKSKPKAGASLRWPTKTRLAGPISSRAMRLSPSFKLGGVRNVEGRNL